MRLLSVLLLLFLGVVSATKLQRASALAQSLEEPAAKTEDEEDADEKRRKTASQMRSEYLMLSEATKKLQALWDKSNEQVLKIRDEREASDKHYYGETKDWINRARKALDDAKATQQKLTNDVLSGRIKIPKAIAKVEATASAEEKKIEKLEKEREEQDPDPKKALAAAKEELAEVAPEASQTTENESAQEVKLSSTKQKFENMMNNKDLKKPAVKVSVAAAIKTPAAATAAVKAVAAAAPAQAVAAVTPAVAAANKAATQVIAQAEKKPAAAAAKPAEVKPVIVPNAAAEKSNEQPSGTIRLNADGEVAPLEPEQTEGNKKVLSKNEMAYRSVTTSDEQNIDPRLHFKVRKSIEEIGKAAYARRVGFKESTQDIPKEE